MASGFEQFYQHLTAEELAEERSRLLKVLATPFMSQAVGSKSYQRSVEETETRLQALAVELSRRSQAGNLGGGAIGRVNLNC